MSESQLWTVERIARATGLSQEQVIALLEGNEIAGYKAGGTWYVQPAEALRFIAAQQGHAERINTA